MANLKEVRNRIVSVNSTQQITKAMKMVAAAKLRRAQDNIIKMRPYSSKLNDILSNVSATLDSSSVENAYGTSKEEVSKVLIVVITSDRGLCGGFNSSVTKAVLALIEEKYTSQKAAGNLELLCIGKKGYEYFERRKFTINSDYTGILIEGFGKAKEAAEHVMAKFVAGDYDVVDLVYNEFKNVATQVVRAEQFLPIEEKIVEEGATVNQDYIFEPSKEYIIQELIPKSLKLKLYKAILESNASEHGARMTAMDKATENAGDLLKELKLTYNRTRQAAITTEILEIVGGAEALNN